MAEPFLAEIRLMSFAFAPRGWAFCNGQLLPMAQNAALFSLLGTTYGGDGTTVFALPDLRGRTALHPGGAAGLTLGTGTQAVSVSATDTEILSSFDVARGLASSIGTTAAATGTSTISADSPYLTVSFCIALQGIYPSQF